MSNRGKGQQNLIDRGNQYGMDIDDTFKSGSSRTTKYKWKCRAQGHIVEMSCQAMTKYNGCPSCNNIQLNANAYVSARNILNPIDMNNICNHYNITIIGNHTNYRTTEMYQFNCKEGHPFTCTYAVLLRQKDKNIQICPTCKFNNSLIGKMSILEQKYNLIFNPNSLETRKKTYDRSKFEWKCNSHGHIFTLSVKALDTIAKGCPDCPKA